MRSLLLSALGVLTLAACSQGLPPQGVQDSVTSGQTPPEQSAALQTEAVTPSIKLPPSGAVAWDWQIGASENQLNASGLKLIDVDGWGTSAATVAKLKAQGAYTVCYLDVGSYEPGRPDSAKYPNYLKIEQDPDWPDEYFLDVTDVFKSNSALAGILKARFAMCKQKGFDAVEPDNLQNDENVSSGQISTQEQIDFNGWVADAVHAAGMAVLQKNGPDKILLKDRTGKLMVDKFDGILNEQCQEYGECGALGEYSKRGKLVLEAEYERSMTLNCTLSRSLKLNMIKRDLNLTAPGSRSYSRVSC